jgi:hypothetical protein
MLNPGIGGKFVIAVHGYKDTQYGEADYPSYWFVSGRKYTLGTNLDKIKKFDSFYDAEKYISSRQPKYTANRSFEILYLTGKWWKEGETLNQFHALEDETAESIDCKLIDQEIDANVGLLKTYQRSLKDLSNRSIKTKEEYLQKISSLEDQITFLKKQRSKLTAK